MILTDDLGIFHFDEETISPEKFKELLYEQRLTKCHRTDGPAHRYMNGFECWIYKGRFHRINGPAMTNENHNLEVYYFWGIEYPKEEYDLIMKSLETIKP